MSTVKNLEVGNCYSMQHGGKTVRFRLIKYTSIDDTYYIRPCGTDEQIPMRLTTENMLTLQEIDCTGCDGKLSATEQMKL